MPIKVNKCPVCPKTCGRRRYCFECHHRETLFDDYFLGWVQIPCLRCPITPPKDGQCPDCAHASAYIINHGTVQDSDGNYAY
jgi:hypothetical protein